MTSPNILSNSRCSPLRVAFAALFCFSLGCGKKPQATSSNTPEPAPGTSPTPTPPKVTNDAEALAGTWQISSIDPGDPESFRPREMEAVKKLTGTVKGDKLTTTRPDGKPMTLLIQVDQTKNPRMLFLFPLDDSGNKVTERRAATGSPPRDVVISFKLLYRLDGDSLTIAGSDDTQDLCPVELKAAVKQDCVHYEGTNETGRKRKAAVALAVLNRVK